MLVNELMDLAHSPRTTVPGGISLANALYAAKPANPAELLERQATQMKAQAELLSRRWGARDKAAGERASNETKLADRRIDSMVRALQWRVSAAALLPSERYAEAAQAQSLVDSLFPSGLAWLNLRFDEEWAHADKLLKRIDDEKLAATIDTIAGPAYLAELRLAFAQYGEVLGKTQARPADAEAITLAEDHQELNRRIGVYVLQVVATADSSKPETLEAARRALLPLIDYRAAMSRSRAAEKRSAADAAPTATPTAAPVTPA